MDGIHTRHIAAMRDVGSLHLSCVVSLVRNCLPDTEPTPEPEPGKGRKQHAARGTRRAASILASTSARIRERRVRAATSVTSVTSEKQRPPPVRKRKRRERYRVMETNGERFYELV